MNGINKDYEEKKVCVHACKHYQTEDINMTSHIR